MSTQIRYKVGSKIVERGAVFRVFKIVKENFNGKSECIIHYSPHYKTSSGSEFVCSIPESSLVEANIRNPVSKKEMQEHLAALAFRPKNPDTLDTVQAKTSMNQNDIEQTIEVLRACCVEKAKDDENFSKPKQDILNLAVDRIVEEVALVYDISIEKAKKKIFMALKN